MKVVAIIQARSVFLQVLLQISTAAQAPAFARWADVWQRWHEWLDHSAVALLQVCLALVQAHVGVARIVGGVGSAGHLREIAAAFAWSSAEPISALGADDRDVLEAP